jgi:hypothetical protein
MNKERGLTVRCLRQFFDWTVPSDLAQFAAEDLIGSTKNIRGSGKLIRQILSHANDLRTLPGEQQRDLCHLLLVNRGNELARAQI